MKSILTPPHSSLLMHALRGIILAYTSYCVNKRVKLQDFESNRHFEVYPSNKSISKVSILQQHSTSAFYNKIRFPNFSRKVVNSINKFFHKLPCFYIICCLRFSANISKVRIFLHTNRKTPSKKTELFYRISFCYTKIAKCRRRNISCIFTQTRSPRMDLVA